MVFFFAIIINFKGTINKNFVIEKDPEENSGEENKPSGEDKTEEDNSGGEDKPKEGNSSGEDKPKEGNLGENNSDGENQSGNQKPEKEQQKQPENKTPLEAVKDSLSNLKLPFTGTKDYGYISTPYFWINVLAILIFFAIYLLICRNENKDQ